MTVGLGLDGALPRRTESADPWPLGGGQGARGLAATRLPCVPPTAGGELHPALKTLAL